jgi:hypothetical protein
MCLAHHQFNTLGVEHVLALVVSLGEQRFCLTLVLLALALGGVLHCPCCVAVLALLNASVQHRLPKLLSPLALHVAPLGPSPS